MSEIDLYNGDCLEVMKQIPDNSVDLILCDLPYGTTQNKWDIIIPFSALWEQYNRIKKENAPVVLFGTQPFTSLMISSNLTNFKYVWYWDKVNKMGGFLNAKKQPLRIMEDIAVFYTKQPIYNPQFSTGKAYKVGNNKSKTAHTKEFLMKMTELNITQKHFYQFLEMNEELLVDYTLLKNQ